jgi:hypothetical protein
VLSLLVLPELSVPCLDGPETGEEDRCDDEEARLDCVCVRFERVLSSGELSVSVLGATSSATVPFGFSSVGYNPDRTNPGATPSSTFF